MSALALMPLLALVAPPPEPQNPLTPLVETALRNGTEPETFTVRPVSAERTISEFMDLCFRPSFSADAIESSLKRAGLAYTSDHDEKNPQSWRWRSSVAVVALEIPHPGYAGLWQCTVSIGTVQPRTRTQIMAALKPAVEAEVGREVLFDTSHASLEWSDTDPAFINRISLGNADSKPTRSLWYVFDHMPRLLQDAISAASKKRSRNQKDLSQ